MRGGLQDAGRDLGVAPDAKHVDFGQASDEFFLGQGTVERLNPVARLGQDGRRVGVNVFQQQDADVLRVERSRAIATAYGGARRRSNEIVTEPRAEVRPVATQLRWVP